MKNRIVLVTSGQPSANPRLIKEIMALKSQGFQLTVIWCPISPWADGFDQELFKKYPDIQWIKAGYHFKLQKFNFFYARIRKKIWKLVFKLVGNRFDAGIKSFVLYSQELNMEALKHPAELYIGHNLGSLPAIFSASKYYNAKSIFDFEDYHRGEFDENSQHSKMAIKVENLYFPQISAITTASPSITQVYKNIFPHAPMTTINNCFPFSLSIDYLIDLPQKPLKLFWFSQYIGKMRGLETVIESMSRFSTDEITLTLLGTASNEIKLYFKSLSKKLNLSEKQLVFLNPVSEKEIVQIAAQHHIGLASEYAHNVNRDLCLTNKIFMYLLAGNALVLSDTHAQKTFLSENPGIGSLYEQNNVQQLTSVLKTYIGTSKLLLSQRQNALELAKTKYNWDIEQYQFLDNVKSVLTS